MMNIILAAMTMLVVLCHSPLQAKTFTFKIASVAPEGSVWINHFRDFAEEVNNKTNGEVVMKVYPGGVMGDDLAMYRKLRAGQLQGGGFTMSGISNAVPDFRVMAIPFYFNNYEEIDAVTGKLIPYFKQQFSKEGLEFISMTEVGLIYGMSTSPTATIDELRQRKSWIPEGDPLTANYLHNLGINPIPLSIPDVLSSLQTGLIDTVYTSLYGTIVMQWFTKATYITDFPYGYAYGAIIFSKKAFSRLPESYTKIIYTAADKHFTALNRKTRQTNAESRAVLEENGVSFIKTPPEAIAELQKTRQVTIDKLIGTAFSRKAFSMMDETIKNFRSKQQP